MKIYILSIILFLTGLHYSNAQESWTLQNSIERALSNNLQLKKSQLNTGMAKTNLTQSKGAVLPNINGFATHNYNFGQTIDPFTNTFANQTVQSNSFALSGNLTLFNGLQVYNNIKQSQLDYEAGKYDAEKLKNDVVLGIMTSYIQVLYAEDLVANANSQTALTRSQGERITKLVNAGSLAKGSLLDIEAQFATEDLQLADAQNQLTLSYLTFAQLLEVPYTTDLKVVRPSSDFPVENIGAFTPEGIYQTALSNQPQIKSAEVKLQSAKKGLAIAHGGRSPRLSANASYGTGYSGLQQRPIGSPTFNGYDTIGVTGGFVPEVVLIPNFSYQFEKTPFWDQIDNNFNQSFGFSLSVPILNGLSVHSNISRAKIGWQNAELDLAIAKQQLQKDIQQAYADAVNAIKKHQAAQRSVDALKESFKYVEQRFNVGLVNGIDYNDAKNRLAKAELELLQSKYNYLFKVKVLDFYQGKPLSF